MRLGLIASQKYHTQIGNPGLLRGFRRGSSQVLDGAANGTLRYVAFKSDDNEEIRVDENGVIHKINSSSPTRILHEIGSREAARWSVELTELFGFDGDIRQIGLAEIDRVSAVDDLAPPPKPSPTTRRFWKWGA